MDIQSVISSISSLVNAGAQVSQVQQAEGSEPRAGERVELSEEAPRPVKNAQGQVTGTLVNATA